MTNCTFKFSLINIAFSRSRGEISQAFSATSLLTFGALNHIVFHHEAQWALIITLRKRFQEVGWIKVMLGQRQKGPLRFAHHSYLIY